MLNGKKAIITGGSRGIGLAIAKDLIKNGAKIVICSRTNSELNSSIKQLNKCGNNAFGLKTDVSNFGQCESLVRFASDNLGSIDILINNAGVYGPIGPLEENDHKLWLKTINTNLIGMVYCSKLVIPIMKKNKWGKIINVSGSGAGGKKGLPNFSAYFTSKMAVVGLTEVLAEELKDYNIQVNCVSPGAVNTGLTDYLLRQDPDKVGRTMYDNTLRQKKSGGTSPLFIAKLVTFLSSDMSDHITGRFLSAKWDRIEQLDKRVHMSPNLYKLRRIDNKLFYEQKD